MRAAVGWVVAWALVCLVGLCGCRGCGCGSEEEAIKVKKASPPSPKKENTGRPEERADRAPVEDYSGPPPGVESEDRPPKKRPARTLDLSGKPPVEHVGEGGGGSKAPPATLKTMRILSERQKAERGSKGSRPTNKTPEPSEIQKVINKMEGGHKPAKPPRAVKK